LKEISILIGGKAGDGIKGAGQTIARLLSRLGYQIFLYDEYPSLVKGGHNFNVIRGSDKKIRAHKQGLDIIVALDQETIEKHQGDLKSRGIVLYDSDEVDIGGGLGIPFASIVKEMQGMPIMRNIAAIGALAKSLDIEWSVVEKLIADTMGKQTDLNSKIAQKAYEKVNKPHMQLTRLDKETQPLLTGNQAIALGAVQGGMNMYIAYPMTPSSGILHFLAGHEDELRIVTLQPENEIAVALMALGGAYAGARTMVGTSGGGFALMTEAVSLAGEAEIPDLYRAGRFALCSPCRSRRIFKACCGSRGCRRSLSVDRPGHEACLEISDAGLYSQR
jgi:2-oxoglutarate ferredoxin oxidoreductase subunit alpha